MYPSSAPGRAATTRPMGRVLPTRLPPWGWLEWFLVAQTFIPVLLFVPGASVLRLFTRIAVFVIALVAWHAMRQSKRRPPAGPVFPAAIWLQACSLWLMLSILHPNTNSVMAGAAQAAMYLTVLSPVFWVPTALVTHRQIPRLMIILFLCNAASALVGIGQVYRPGTFNPPVIPTMESGSEIAVASVTYLAADGRTIIRPCGLSDSPGAAAPAGSIACLLGLCLAVRPMGMFKRLACIALALAGMAVIYFCQVRAAMVMLFVCIVGLSFLFSVRRHYRQAMLLGVGSVLMVFVAAVWVVSAVGDVGTKRFMSLIEERPDELYQGARGRFVQETFETLIWQSPLGSGLGRWGQAFGYFGDHSAGYGGERGMIWVEVQWPGWVVDGGIPLLVMYVTALVLAMLDTLRIALHCKDNDLAYWAAVVFALNLATVAATFSASPFVAPYGIGFWLMSAAIHAAELRSHEESARSRRAPALRMA